MTAAEMRYNVLLGVDSFFEAGAPGYNDSQLSAILNRAQRRVFGKWKKLFDANEEAKRILSPVTERASLLETTIAEATVQDYAHPNGILYVLPDDDIAKLVEEYVRFDEGDGVYSDPVIVLPISYDYYTKNYKSRYKKPYSNLVWRLDYNLEDSQYVVELITDGENTIGDYQIAYLRWPVDIVINTTAPQSAINCEILHEGFHDEIVAEAIKMIVAALNDEGYQVAGAERTFDGN